MSTNVLVVDQVFTTLPKALAIDSIEAFLLSMVYANAAARPARSQAASGGATAFRTKWSGALGRSGWIIQDAGSSQLTSSSTGETVSIAERIVAMAGSPAIETALNQLKTVATADDEADTAAARMFWDSAALPGYLQAAIGHLDDSRGSPTLEVVGFVIELDDLKKPAEGLLHFHKAPFKPENAADLFTQIEASSLSIQISQQTMVLQTEVFDKAKAKLKELLGDKVSVHYRAVPASLI